MKPGPELDLLIAKKVMGLLELKEAMAQGGAFLDPGGQLDASKVLRGQPRPYSTNIAAALEVVEKLRKNHALTIHAESLGGGWLVHVDRDIKIISDSAPHAICLVALKAFGA